MDAMYKNLSLLVVVFVLLTGCAPALYATQSTPPTSTAVDTSESSTAPTAVTTPQVLSTSMADSTVLLTYPIIDSGQGKCYNNNAEIPCPSTGEAFYGQDAQYTGLEPSYTNNGDGTVTDNNTGLTWQQSPDRDGNGTITAADKLTYAAASTYCQDLTLAGYTDWRLPDIKTLYSLMDFRGTDPSGASGMTSLIPFLDASYFAFAYGDTSAGERTIDSQFASSTLYVDTNASDGGKDFGVNFADGRIKGYGMSMRGSEKTFFVLCVRGNMDYGANVFVDNGDGTVSDLATGLVWQQADSANGMDWQNALGYCESLSLAGYDDWRLPNAKELQSILDYSRSPATTDSAAIDPLFSATTITNEAGQADYPFYWISTTHANSNGMGETGVYIAFGRAMGYMNNTWVDVHGAGAQRSDPKSGNPADYPTGRGPQGDAIRIYDYVRCVRGGQVTSTPAGNPTSTGSSLTVNVTNTQTQSSGLPAQGEQSSQDSNLPGGAAGLPPQEAINACSSSTQGVACQFTSPTGAVTGTCQTIQQQLACVPASNH
jgi:hypothetical protein